MVDAEAEDALFGGNAYVDLSNRRKIAVWGGDAFAWLNDLISADLTGIKPGESRRSLLLSPTGRIRAVFTVVLHDGRLLLIQEPEQPHSIAELLSRYVLSSHVSLEDRTDELALFAFPGRTDRPDFAAEFSSPSSLGPGVDAITSRDRHHALTEELRRTFRSAGPEDVEAWRVTLGVPRFGVDLTEDDLPQEGGMEDAVSFGKGCYLGQEAVAKVRNLGHPRRILLHLEAERPVAAGEPVCVDGAEVGVVTSAVETPKGFRALARVRWEARDGSLVANDGTPLVPVKDPR